MKTCRHSILLAVIIAMLPAAVRMNAAVSKETIATLESTSSAFTEIARHAKDAVVFIQVERTITRGARHPQQYHFNDPFDFFGDDFLRRFFGPQVRPDQQPQRRFRQMGQGSGFLISADGEILTNHHVVGDADKITVRLTDGREFEAERVGTDPKSEVAVIRIKGDNFPFLEMGNSDDLNVGEWVLAIGNPFGLNATVTAGIVSAKGRSNIGIADYEDFIQTDAAINPGNSGGPLLNIHGKVIGINTAIYSRSGGYMGIGFAIPVNMARQIRNQLVDTGRVTRGYLGVYIQELTRELAEGFGLENNQGILVSDVIPDSPAEKAGIQQGDVIVRLNDRAVDSVPDFRNTVAANPPGSLLRLTILRDGKIELIEANTEPLPDEQAQAVEPSRIMEQLGFTVQELTSELAQRMGYEELNGVIISDVARGSLAERAGLRPGQLIMEANRSGITSIDDFNRQLAKARESTGSVLLRIREGAASRFVIIKLEDE